MSGESLYAIFEFRIEGERLVALFPDTDEGCRRALEWGKSEYNTFHAAKPFMPGNREAYLTKFHGVHIDRQEDE